MTDDAPFTIGELDSLFDGDVPIIMIKLLFPDKSQSLTIGELRQIARALKTPAPHTHPLVTEEMVEAAAAAYWFEVYGKHRKFNKWPDDVYGGSQELFRAGCRAALSAALTAEDGR